MAVLAAVRTYLDRIVREFDGTVEAEDQMRQLALDEPERFHLAARKFLLGDSESDATHLMGLLLMQQDRFLDDLLSPVQHTKQSSLRMFRRLLRIDPSLDVQLARRLPGRGSAWDTASIDTNRVLRALDLLDATSEGRRLLPIVGHLPDSLDTRIAAKATLFVGKRLLNATWTRRYLSHSDARTRANAIEALWGHSEKFAVDIMRGCTSDPHGRVTGNSLVGLYLAGREESKTGVAIMARDARPELRATAAWCMGRLGVPAFRRVLAELLHDRDGRVRSSAQRAVGRFPFGPDNETTVPEIRV
jgi:hypothetical protein